MITVVEAVNVASGLLFMALATFVASVRPRTATNLAFAGYAASYGLYFVVFGLAQALVPTATRMPSPVVLLLGVCVWAITPTLAVLAVSAPRPLGPHERRFLTPSLLVGIAVALECSRVFGPGGVGPAGIFERVGVSFAIGTITGAILLFTLRFHAAGVRDHEQRLVTALLAGSLLLQQGMWAGEGIIGVTVYHPGILVFVANLALGVAWLWLMVRGGGVLARRVAWTALGSVVAGMLLGLFVSTQGMAGFSVGRAVAAALIAYGILRHQLFGIDAKVRWGISRGTLAAAFVTVFFIASEGAQIVFGADNEWLGLLAAGALVFAIAPLQRVAEQLAEKAVPSSAASVPPGAPTEARKNPEEVFRNVLRMAIRDGRLSVDERVHLAEVAEVFGLSAGRAAALVRDAEQDSGVTE